MTVHNVHELLAQGDVWVSKGGAEHRIADMDADYCGNVIRFLERRADTLALDHALFAPNVPVSEIVPETREAIADPARWLANQPLMVALRKRVEVVA